MPARVLLSLILSLSAYSATIEPPDLWASLRNAPAPDPTPDPADYAVPTLGMDASELLQFVLDWSYLGIEDPLELEAVAAVLLPQYEAFLRSRTAAPSLLGVPATPVTPMASALVAAPLEPFLLSSGTTLSPLELTTVPEPRTWLLLGASLIWLTLRLSRRGQWQPGSLPVSSPAPSPRPRPSGRA